MTLRIGIVGAGGNTRLRHIPGFQAIDDVRIDAVCNRSRASSERVAAEFDIPRVHDDWRALVADPALDAVCIGTWPYLHAPITIAALAAGKHVLTEARMAMDLAGARAMQAAAAATDRVAMIVPAPFFLEFEPTVLAMFAEGRFGALLEAHVYALGGAFDRDAPLSWRQRRDLSGNNVMSMGILNETVRRYAGHERTVMATADIAVKTRIDRETGQVRDVDVPDRIGIVAQHENGALCVYHISQVARHGRGTSVELHGTKGAVRFAGGKAHVAFDGADEWTLLNPPASEQGGWRVEEEFVEAIRDASPVTHTHFGDGVKYMEFTEAVRRSLVEGRRIALPLVD